MREVRGLVPDAVCGEDDGVDHEPHVVRLKTMPCLPVSPELARMLSA